MIKNCIFVILSILLLIGCDDKPASNKSCDKNSVCKYEYSQWDYFKFLSLHVEKMSGNYGVLYVNDNKEVCFLDIMGSSNIRVFTDVHSGEPMYITGNILFPSYSDNCNGYLNHNGPLEIHIRTIHDIQPYTIFRR